ncbi:Phenylalanine--tRNA ligase alpha subunit [Buchnera aphidicola (Tetraneura ulmi)]|uniref:phenylalanine--tRNA ligase subunit alpha n=1 Tax=Buchnera aphidicola TaxID=9 RepID=UPI0034645CAE
MKEMYFLRDSIESKINNSKDIIELEKIRVFYLGKKGFLNEKIKELCSINKSFFDKKDDNLKKIIFVNKIKENIKFKIQKKKIFLRKMFLEDFLKKQNLDVSLPGNKNNFGSIHPIIKTINKLKKFFFGLGFELKNGPEIEDIYHNFDALNVPNDHPSRSKQDTFWINSQFLLRTQTSSMQVRSMKNKTPPIRMIMPGKVYRNDNDCTHTPMFHQMEGLVIDSNINLSNLKWIIQRFIQFFFGENIKMRFRSSYFPFTTPSMEVDIQMQNSAWIEVLGCGMVHPNVLKTLNIDFKMYLGFAFGIGIERIAMIKYGIKDIRSFFENDIRFLKQF